MAKALPKKIKAFRKIIAGEDGTKALQNFHETRLTRNGNQNLRHHVFVITVFISVLFFHLWLISEIPRGFYCDELSIGYNASLMARTAHDEHGQLLPVYFEAFGEYKNPLFIYVAALIFKLFGVSETALRATSFTLYSLFLFGIFFLVTRIFRANKPMSFYVLIAAGFLPWFFTLSRIAFEVIAQLAVTTWALFFIHRTYHETGGKNRLTYALLAGLFLGLSIYSYSTARLLSFLMLCSVVTIYVRNAFRKTMILVAAFLGAFIPYIVFAINYPGALTRRFGTISYLFDSTLTGWKKASIFTHNYLSYFGPDFLLFTGDNNLRHATGYGGQVFFVVFVLFMLGLIWVIIRRSLFAERFQILLFVNMLFSPIAASLTREGVAVGPHSLRSILLGLYVLLFSCYGLAAILTLKNALVKGALVFLVFVGIVFQASLYLNYYYSEYENVSIPWFETYDFKDTLVAAIKRHPTQIVISNQMNQAYILPSFYLTFIENPWDIPILLSDRLTPMRNTCFIYPGRASIWARLDQHYPNFYDAGFKKSLMRIRCY